MFSNNRDAYRQAFFIAWQKYQKKSLLEPVEAQLIEVILLHPEYHSLLEKPETYQTQEFPLEENPFLHLSLHLAIREQIRTNRPRGIAQIHAQLIEKYTDAQIVEHHMMNSLAKIMEKAQQDGTMPNETEYLQGLKNL